MPRLKPLLLFSALLVAAVPAVAVPPDPVNHRKVDLATVVQAAVQRHPEYQILAPADLEASALGGRARSLVSEQPSVSLHLLDDQVGSDRGQREWEAGVALPLWRPGQRRAARSLADAAREAATLRRLALTLQVAGEVREAVWSLAITRNRERLAEQELATARELERQVEIMVRRGDVPRTDLLLAREETLQRQVENNAAHLEAHHALIAYQALTGMTSLPQALVEARASSTIDHNPLLVESQATASRALAEQALLRAQGGGAPTLNIGGRSEQDGSGETRDSMGIGFSIPLGLKSQRGPAEASAALQLARAQAARDHQQRRLSLALTEAEESIAMSEETLVIAQARHALAAENLRLARRAYELGETSLAELLRVQTRAFAAERDAVLRELERDRAIARFNQALGVTP